MTEKKSFIAVLTEAVDWFMRNGFTNQSELDRWIGRLRFAATHMMQSSAVTDRKVSQALTQGYEARIKRDREIALKEGVSRFTVEKIKPKLRSELNRRIRASADLIKLNRDEAIAKTLRRFEGWTSSIPPGGTSGDVTRRDKKREIYRDLKQMPFVERRVLIDQGHKLASNISSILAVQNNAIAAKWHSRWRVPGYDYREDHRERDEHVYLIRGSWAQNKGLVKPSLAGYSDEITQPAEEPFCMCNFQYLYFLPELPADMLTEAGRKTIAIQKQAA